MFQNLTTSIAYVIDGADTTWITLSGALVFLTVSYKKHRNKVYISLLKKIFVDSWWSLVL